MSAQSVDGVLISGEDAMYVMAVIDALIVDGRGRGAVPSRRLVRLRNELAIATTRVGTRVNASTEVVSAAEVLALAHEECVDSSTAATELGITADGVRDHCRRGNLDYQRVGGRYMITAASIEELKTRRTEARSA